MPIFQACFTRFVALVSLSAVVLGVLEHEDLIWQNLPHARAIPAPAARASVGAATAAVAAAAAPSHGQSDAQWSASASTSAALAVDRGAEGTFRSPQHRFWLSPRPGGPYTRRPWRLRQPPPRAASTAGRAVGGWWRQAGIVALRL